MADELKGEKKPVQKASGGEGEKFSHGKISSGEGPQGSDPAGNDDALKFVPKQIPGGSGSGEGAGDAEGGKTTPANNKTGDGGAGAGDEGDGGRDTGELTSWPKGRAVSDPEQVEACCTDSVEITRKTLADLADELKGKKTAVTDTGTDAQGGGQNSGAGEADKFAHEQISGGAGEFFVMTKFPVVAEAAKARAKVVPEHLSALKFASTVYTPDFMAKAS